MQIWERKNERIKIFSWNNSCISKNILLKFFQKSGKNIDQEKLSNMKIYSNN